MAPHKGNPFERQMAFPERVAALGAAPWIDEPARRLYYHRATTLIFTPVCASTAARRGGLVHLQNLAGPHILQHLADTAGPMNFERFSLHRRPRPKCTRLSLEER